MGRAAIHLIYRRRRALGLHRTERRRRHRRGAAMPVFGQRMFQPRNDQPARKAGIAKPHFGLGRVHIHIHQFRITLQKQRHHGMAIPAHHIRIGSAKRAIEHAIPHRAAIDEQILRHRRALGIGRQSGQAAQVKPRARGIYGHGVFGEVPAQYPRQPCFARIFQKPGRGGDVKQGPRAVAAPVCQGKGNGGRGHGQAADHIADSLGFGPIGAQEFQPRGRGIEQIPQRHPGAARPGRRAHRPGPAAIHGNLGGLLPRTAAFEGQAPNRPERGKRLAPEAQKPDIQQIIAIQFRCRMPRQRQRQLIRRDAMAIIGNLDQPLAAIGYRHGDPAGPGIECVFHQFFHRRGRTFHDLARRDPVGCGVVQLADRPWFGLHVAANLVHATRYSMMEPDSATGEWL